MIRKAVIEDAEKLSLISIEAANGDELNGFYLEEDTREEYEELISEKEVYVCVNEEGCVSGYISLRDFPPEYITKLYPEYKGYKYVGGLAVSINSRRKGVARELKTFIKEKYDCLSDVFFTLRPI